MLNHSEHSEDSRGDDMIEHVRRYGAGSEFATYRLEVFPVWMLLWSPDVVPEVRAV
jgi:hypothetical protein